MKTKKNVFNAEKQSENRVPREVKSLSKESIEGDKPPAIDENTFRNDLSGNSKKNRKNPSYSFVVDWQIPESSE